MSKLFRYFKSNIISGCRLADIDKYVTKDEIFYLNAHIACTSRSVAAALKHKWILEITEKEAAQFITIPDASIVQIQKEEITLENVKESKANLQINEAALKRQQEYLKKIEEKSKMNQAIQEEDEELNIEPGKNEEVNLAALDRIKKFQKKRSGIENTKKAYLQEFTDLDQKSSDIRHKIEKQIRKTPEERNKDLLINKEAKTIIENDINNKIEEKKLPFKRASEIEIIEDNKIEEDRQKITSNIEKRIQEKIKVKTEEKAKAKETQKEKKTEKKVKTVKMKEVATETKKATEETKKEIVKETEEINKKELKEAKKAKAKEKKVKGKKETKIAKKGTQKKKTKKTNEPKEINKVNEVNEKTEIKKEIAKRIQDEPKKRGRKRKVNIGEN